MQSLANNKNKIMNSNANTFYESNPSSHSVSENVSIYKSLGWMVSFKKNFFFLNGSPVPIYFEPNQCDQDVSKTVPILLYCFSYITLKTKHSLKLSERHDILKSLCSMYTPGGKQNGWCLTILGYVQIFFFLLLFWFISCKMYTFDS